MSEIRDFDMLEVGQHVKIEGKYLSDSILLALEINIRPPAHNNVIVGMIENIDLKRNELTILGKRVQLSGLIEIKNRERKKIRLDELRSGMMVKLTGHFHSRGAFETRKIREEKTLDFNIDKMKGVIERIDTTAHTIEVNGFTVTLNSDTAIEKG